MTTSRTLPTGVRRMVRGAVRRGIAALPRQSQELVLSVATLADTREGLGPRLLPGPPPGPVLVVAPHPDDEVIGSGGAIARHVAEGHSVAVLVVTSGGATAGGDRRETAQDVASRREAETIRALSHLGVTSPPVFAGLPDGDLTSRIDDVAQLIAHHAAGVATVYLPWLRDPHPDHRATAQAAARAGLANDVTLMGYEVWGAAPVDALLDVTTVFAAKQAALAEYRVALQTVDYVRSVSGLAAFRSASAGMGGRGFAEGFVTASVSRYQALAASLADGQMRGGPADTG